ncbi:hypothetical protein SprV_0301310300 [Sparganum proliferum]
MSNQRNTRNNVQKGAQNGALGQLKRLEYRVAATEEMNQKVLKEISDLKLKLNGFRRSESDASALSHISGERQLLTENSSISPDDTESSIYAVERQRTHQSTSPSRNRANSNKGQTTAFERTSLESKVSSIEQVLQKVSADLKTLTARCGSQTLDIQTIYKELKNFDSKYEKTMKNEVDLLRTELSPFVKNPSQISNAIKRLQSSLLDLQKNRESENNAMLRFQNTIHSSLHDYASRLTDVERQSNEAIQHLRSEVRENAQMSNSTRISMQKELEQMSSKIDARLSSALKRLQEEHASSRKEVEAVLGRFTVRNSSCEQKVAEVESSTRNLEESLSKDLAKLREDQQENQNKLLTSLSQLDLAVELLERGLSDEKEQLKAVIAAEIKTRSANVTDINFQLRDIVSKFGLKSSTMELAIDGMRDKCEKIEQMVKGRNESSVAADGVTADTTELKNQLNDLEKTVSELQKSTRQEGASETQEDLLKSLTNVAESVQAVKAALLKKIEDFENETKEKLTQLDSELDAMKHTFNSYNRNGLSFIAIADASTSQQQTLNFLRLLESKFTSDPTRVLEAHSGSEHCHQIDFGRVLAAEMANFSQQDRSKVMELRGQVADVSLLMQKNIADLNERGTKLDDLFTKTEAMESDAAMFQTTAQHVKLEHYWDNCRTKIILFSALFVLVLIIVLIILWQTGVFEQKSSFATVVSTYAPHEVWNRFHEDVNALLATVPRADKSTVLGDFSAYIRTDHAAWEGVLGPHRLGGCNDSGLFYEPAQNSLLSSTFRLPTPVKATRVHPSFAALAVTGLRSPPQEPPKEHVRDQSDLLSQWLDGLPPLQDQKHSRPNS